jgi:hypothetical protein
MEKEKCSKVKSSFGHSRIHPYTCKCGDVPQKHLMLQSHPRVAFEKKFSSHALLTIL